MFGVNEINFKRKMKYTDLWNLINTYIILCNLYLLEEKPCKNPQRKCKNCSVYNGFKDVARLYEQKTK